MANGSGMRRGIMIFIGTLALATAACGGPATTGVESDPNSVAEGASATPEAGAVVGTSGTDSGGSNSGGGDTASDGGSGGGGGGSGSGSSGGGSGSGSGGGGSGSGGDGSSSGNGDGGSDTGGAGGGEETGPPGMSPAECLYGKWNQQTGTWTLPGSSWGLSGTVTVNFASSTTNTQQNVILFERNADVGRNVYTEDLEANYTQGYGNPQPSLTLSGRDYGDFSVSGSTVTFSNGSIIQMVYRMDTVPVSTKNVKRLVTTAQFSCSATTLEISDSKFTGTYTRLY